MVNVIPGEIFCLPASLFQLPWKLSAGEWVDPCLTERQRIGAGIQFIWGIDLALTEHFKNDSCLEPRSTSMEISENAP